ncbi:hypothetical protein NFI96_004515 [Prochilodus magdalenae]|nr:hypothetical protein NFI96_004515 [Prochilodus magdalenae]
MDPHQFAYRSNRSTDDAIALTVHSALTHLDRRNTYVGMLFIDYSSAFNTTIPAKLIPKLTDLGLNSHLDFLTGRPQVVRVGNSFLSTLTLSTGAPQGSSAPSCVARHTSNKFADDTTILDLFTDVDGTAYRDTQRPKDSSSPVVCHATGFYPKPVMISWKKNGEDLDEGVELRETLPNQDGTFQKRSILTVPPEELYKHNYTCIIQHSSLEKEIVLTPVRVLSRDQLRNSVELHGMGFQGEQLHPSLTSPSSVQSVECSGVKLHPWTLEQWRRVLWSDQSHFSICQSDARVWVRRSPGERLRSV